MTVFRSGILVVVLTLTSAHTGAAQEKRMGRYGLVEVPAEILERPLSLREGIGHTHEVVTTLSEDAQAYYDQGVAYLHSYIWVEAARSFHQALRYDGNLAMAYVGLSYALGELGASEEAESASRQASALVGHVTDRERLRIELRAKQLGAYGTPDKQLLRTDYLNQFDQVLSDNPNDVELLLLRGHAEENSEHAAGMGGGRGSIRYYERALAGQPHYFAIHHYLTHAYENVGLLDRALEHAAEYVRLAPAVPHAHHMYGHVLRRVERMQEAIAEFLRADELSLAYFRAEKIAPEYDWQYHHNLDLLGTSYEYAGEMRLAEANLRRSFVLPSIELSQELNEKALPLLLLEQERAQEALTASEELMGRPEPVIQALGHLLASRALLALGRIGDASEEGDQAIPKMREAGGLGGVLVPELELTQGEFLLRKGQRDRGGAMLRGAVARLRADPGPDAWIQTLFRLESACRVSREVGAWDLAGELTRQMQQYDPAYAGTHYALARIAEERGDFGTAREQYQAAIKAWNSADADFAGRTDARRRLARLERPFTGGRK
jgi:tetratricopeptide (TPR) repeat protein